MKIVQFVFLSNLIALTLQQDETEDGDECAFISGQHCDQNGICKYCAMCIQSSCILSKTTNCNTTQFGTTDLYNWYDYCLSSENDSDGDYCATSTECYQYRKSTVPSVTYAWHNLTCNPSTCMLIASNGAPPPIPVPPQPTSTLPSGSNTNENSSDTSDTTDRNESRSTLHNPATIALTIICCLVILVALFWILRVCKKKHWWPFKASRVMSHNSITSSSIPSSAPPSFSSTPPEMASLHNQRVLYATTHQPSIRSGRSSSSTNTSELLPSYLSPYHSPPKYEQAIVTQIRGLREESSSSSAIDHHQNAPSMWVPVYFTQQQPGRRGTVELFGFTPNYPMPSYFLHPSGSARQQPQENPFDDGQETHEEEQETRHVS